MRALVVDAGAFIAAERKSRALAALVRKASTRVITSANVIAEIWRPTPAWEIAVMLNGIDSIIPVTLDQAQRIGEILALSGTAQITDAHIVAIAIDHRPSLVLTSDPADIERLLASTGTSYRRGAAPGQGIDVIVEPV